MNAIPMKRQKKPLTCESIVYPGRSANKTNNASSILDSLLEGVQIIDFQWRYLYVNQTVMNYEQSSTEPFLNHTVLTKYPGIQHTDVFASLESCMLERRSSRIEIEFVYADQSTKWFQLSIDPVKEGIRVLSLDISERKDDHERLKRLKRLYAFISQVNQKIVRVKDQNTLFANACQMALEFGKFKAAWIGLCDNVHPYQIAMAAYCGISDDDSRIFHEAAIQFSTAQESVIKSGTHYISNKIDQDAAMEAWKPYAIKNNIQSCIILPIRKSGKIIATFNLYSSDVDFSYREEVALLIEVTSDVSFALDLFEKEKLLDEHLVERKRAEESLILKNDELEKTNAELDRFVYSVSHDLRAPLSSLLGLISLTEMVSKETETLAYSKMMRNSVTRLDNFISNILNYSKNNRLELQTGMIDISKTVNNVIESLRHSKEGEAIEFHVDIDEQVAFYSDLNRVTIVLENLISNAIKFQDIRQARRTISVKGKVSPEALVMTIEDNGIGIAIEYQSKIFDMFFRISGEQGGSGIGLYIVKETVHKLQGTISVDPKKLEGSTFRVNLKNSPK